MNFGIKTGKNKIIKIKDVLANSAIHNWKISDHLLTYPPYRVSEKMAGRKSKWRW